MNLNDIECPYQIDQDPFDLSTRKPAATDFLNFYYTADILFVKYKLLRSPSGDRSSIYNHNQIKDHHQG